MKVVTATEVYRGAEHASAPVPKIRREIAVGATDVDRDQTAL